MLVGRTDPSHTTSKTIFLKSLREISKHILLSLTLVIFMSKHTIEALGLSRITVENGKVTDVTEPQVEYCPLFHKYQGIEKLTKEAIAKNIQFRIDDFGMCTADRQLRMKDFLSFGISEILSTLLEEGEIDCVVMVCEGCGTVIITESEMAQGVGGRVSGLVETSPIPEVIDAIGRDNVVDVKTAAIDQIEGIKLAISKGFKNIAVTIALADDAQKINRLKEDNPDINIYVFVVHTSKRSPEEAMMLFVSCEVGRGCASKNMREIGYSESLKTVGQSIPIFSKTEMGKRFIELRLDKIGGEKPKKDNAKIPDPLI